MFELLLASAWFWGFAGAFIYAAPRLSTCIFNARGEGGPPWQKCAVDAGFSVTIGPLAAGAFTGTLQSKMGLQGAEHLPAVAAVIGLLANPVAPGAIEVMTTGVIERIRKMVGGVGK